MKTSEICFPPHTVHERKQSRSMINDLDTVDFIFSNIQSARQEALLHVLEDNEPVIKMIMKGRNPTIRHFSRTYRVACDWLFDRINQDSKIQIKYIDTKKQLADKLTKGNSLHTWWMESSFVCFTFAISVLQFILKWCREEHKKTQVKKESQQSRNCIRKPKENPDTKVKLLWVRKLKGTTERETRCIRTIIYLHRMK